MPALPNVAKKNLGQLRNVLQIIRHPNWNRNTFANDIALIRLSSPLTFNANVQGIQYATANDAGQGFTNPGVNARISGWGLLATNGAQPDHLQAATVPIRNINTLNPNQYAFDLTGNMIAAGNNGTGVCHGDSGGPLVVFDGTVPLVAGITSFRSIVGCANSNNPEIFTRVSNYCGWISDRIAAIEGPTTVCTSNTTFNLRNGPATGATVTWTAAPAGRFTPSSGTGTVATLRTTDNGPGTGTLTFTVTSGCGTTTVSRSITTNISPVNMPQYTYNGPFATIYAEVDPVPGAISYEWYLNGQFQQVSSYNHEFTVYACGDYTTSVRAQTSACGWTAQSTAYFSVVCPGGFSLYPNPADKELTIEYVSEDDGASLPSVSMDTGLEQKSFSIVLYNPEQEKVAAATADNGKINLDTSRLPAGKYVLHIYYKDAILRRQVIVK